MSADVIPLRKDRYEALMKAAEEYEGYVLGAVKYGINNEIPVAMMIGVLSRTIIDLDFNAISFEPEEPA